MTRQLRHSHSPSRSGAEAVNGLILANGGVATYQHVLILSRNPRPADSPFYPTHNPLPEILIDLPGPPSIAERPEGEAVIEVNPFPIPPPPFLGPRPPLQVKP